MVQLLPGGGAITAVDADDTAVLWRDIAFIVQYDAYWTAPQDAEPTINWVDGFRQAMLPYTEGAYVNYVDERLDDPLRAYYGEHLERLVEVKRKYDPENVFHFPQSVPTDLDNLAETQEDGAGDDKSDGTQDTGDGAGLRLTSRVYDC